jgi:hypothetical protein
MPSSVVDKCFVFLIFRPLNFSVVATFFRRILSVHTETTLTLSLVIINTYRNHYYNVIDIKYYPATIITMCIIYVICLFTKYCLKTDNDLWKYPRIIQTCTILEFITAFPAKSEMHQVRQFLTVRFIFQNFKSVLRY